MFGVIPIATALWVLVKSGYEVYAQVKYYKAGKFIEDSEAHTHQHLAVGIGFVVYGLCVPIMIVWGGFEFSNEWIPLNTFVGILFLYVVEHFAIEREQRGSVIRFRDLFLIKKIKQIEHERL